MRTLIPHILACLEQSLPAAYCRLVETRGSTPQKAGAAMLVYANGDQQGTLGGGCVEAEVRRRAMQTLVGGRSEVARFQLDHDYGWDDGLICGGRMEAVIEPLRADRHGDYFRQLDALLRHGRAATEVIQFEAGGSAVPVPRHFLLDAGGEVLAAIGAARDALNADFSEHLRPITSRPGPYAVRGFAFLPILPRCRLVIVGGGHVGKAVADLAVTLDFDVWVVEDRAEFASPERFPQAQRRLVGKLDEVLASLEVDSNTYCLIVTRGHNHDARALYHLADRGARYVGMIGSRRKIRVIFEDLLHEGVSAEALSRVHAPVGIDIGSQTVAEIAVSIAAELVSHRNRAGEVPGRPAGVHVPAEHLG